MTLKIKGRTTGKELMKKSPIHSPSFLEKSVSRMRTILSSKKKVSFIGNIREEHFLRNQRINQRRKRKEK
jgi:hypothetical protein